VRYLGYRLDGCVHEEAAEKTFRHLRGERELRVCKNATQRKPLPAASETYDFRRRLESLYASQPAFQTATSYVDLEGEAVWLQEYLRQRLNGRDHSESTEVVLRAIRSIAPTPP
jgi:hypothetical protein